MTTLDATGPSHRQASTELALTGMTCASCAARIQRKLNKLDGVTATVNFATEKASVDYDSVLTTPDELVAAVEAAGYSATLPRDRTEANPAEDADHSALAAPGSKAPAGPRRVARARADAGQARHWY